MQRSHVLAFAVAAGLLLLGARTALAGWPWSSSEPKKTANTKTARPVKKEPSTLDKVSSGTKKLFTDLGDTLTLKKKSPPKKKPVTGYGAWSTAQQPEKKSWLGSMFPPKEPETPKTPTDFVGQKRVDW